MSPILKFTHRSDHSVHQTANVSNFSAGSLSQTNLHSYTEETYSCPYDSEDWNSVTSKLVKTFPEVSLGKDEEIRPSSPPKQPSSRRAITITIPLPWSKKSSRRSSSVPTTSNRRRFEEPHSRPQISPPSLQASKFVNPIPVKRHEVGLDFYLGKLPAHINDETSPSDVSNSSHGATAGHRRILSPVNEAFERSTASGATSIDQSPATPIDASVQFPKIMPAPSPKELLRQGTVQRAEFALPLTSHPTLPRVERCDSRVSSHSQKRSPGLGLASTAYMRSPSVSAGDSKPRSPDMLLRTRSPSAPPVQRTMSGERHHRQSDDLRRDSDSTTDSSSIVVTDDDESVGGLFDEIIVKERRNWRDRVGTGGTGFYRSVLDDYKMISKGVSEDTRQGLKQQELGDPSPKVDILDVDEFGAPQALVPPGEELWG